MCVKPRSEAIRRSPSVVQKSASVLQRFRDADLTDSEVRKRACRRMRRAGRDTSRNVAKPNLSGVEARDEGAPSLPPLRPGLRLSRRWSCSAAPLQAQAPSAAAAYIETYYQELMPTIRQAARLPCASATSALLRHYRRLDLPDDDTAGGRPALKSFSPAAGSPGGLHAIHRRRLCEPDKRLFGRKLCRRSADQPGIAWRRRDRQDEVAAARWADREHQLSGAR
jgi:hypothetical protein